MSIVDWIFKIGDNLKSKRRDVIINAFWKKLDKANTLDRKLADLTRRYSMVRNLDDLERLRREVANIIKTLESWKKSVSAFDPSEELGKQKLGPIEKKVLDRMDLDAERKKIDGFLTNSIKEIEIESRAAINKAEDKMFERMERY